MNRVHDYSVLTFMPWHKKMWSDPPPFRFASGCPLSSTLGSSGIAPLALASHDCSDVEDAEPLLADFHQMNRSEYY